MSIYALISDFRVLIKRITTPYLLTGSHHVISRKELLRDIASAIQNKTGYAVAKIGGAEQYMLYYPIALKRTTKRRDLERFEEKLKFFALKHGGIFPADLNYYRGYIDFYAKQARNIDCLGIFYYKTEKDIVKHYNMSNKLIYFRFQEPDRSCPSNDNNCYLQYFHNKKILIICPFAKLLKERATKQAFENIWSKTGKKWFYPERVEAIEFPYGFDPETHNKYSNAMALLDHIKSEIDKIDFDIALIAAAGLAIPIASHIKNMGKVGISLGGHLQVLFGVIGKRWRYSREWRRHYFNEYWIDTPKKYKPIIADACDYGAYW